MMIRGGGDYQLFAIEKYDGPFRNGDFRGTADWKKLEDALKKIKPSEAFAIKKKWAPQVHRIVKELQLAIKISVVKIEGNDKHSRVVRIH